MSNSGNLLRQAAGMFLLALLVLLFFVAFRLTLPAPPAQDALYQPGAYPPPDSTPTPAMTAGEQSYPPPGGVGASPTSMPTSTPTPTPWQVSDLPVLKAYPSPSPIGEMRIIYTGDKQLGFWVTDLSGSEKLLWPAWPEDQRDGNPTDILRVSPDGSQIIYSLWCIGPGCDWMRTSIWIMNPDGSGKRQLVAAAEDWYPVDAIWSPDGKQIAYRAASLDSETHMPASRELWVMNADGSQPRRLLNDATLFRTGMEAPAFLFRWLSNGYIYFASHSLYAVNPQDGSLYRLMDNVDAIDLSFSLSPDGSAAWASRDLPAARLQSAGFRVVELPLIKRAVWSPDGLRLAYVAAGAGGTWLRDLPGGAERQLLPYTPGEDVQLRAFSPDNRYLAYQTGAGLYIFDLATASLEPKQVLVDPHRDGMGSSLNFVA